MHIRHFFIKLLFGICLIHSTISQGGKHFPNRDEFDTIDRSRKIIKKIEGCSPDARDSSSKPSDESEMPTINSEEDVVCGETTFMQITRLNENKIQNVDVMRNAMSTTYKAIQKANTFIDIANYIEKSIAKPKSGSWLTIVGRTANYDTSLKDRLPEYLDFTISHIKVQIFNIEANCNANGRYATPSPDTNVYNGAVINPQAVAVIKRNSMPADQRKETLKIIKKALKEYATTEGGVNYLCPYVTNELTVQYGRNAAGELVRNDGAVNNGAIKWACVAGERNYYQFTTTLDQGVQLQAQYDNLLIEVVEVPQGSVDKAVGRNCPSTSSKLSLLTQYDVINAARNMLDFNYVEVNETRMDNLNRQKAIQSVIDSVAVQPTFDAISKDLQRRFEKIWGQYWTAIVGTDTQFWTYFYVQNPFFINLKIDKLRIIAYKQMQ